MLIADFTNKTKTRSATLTVSALEDGRRAHIKTFKVEGKAHARKICENNNIKPWNF